MLDQSQPRRVIPRWRSSWITAKTAEAWAKPSANKPDYGQAIARKEQELSLASSVPVASELMFLAIQAGNNSAAKRAAELIVGNADKIGATRLVATAKRVLEGIDSTSTPAPSHDFVSEARKLLAVDFRNPILLTDVARELTAKGHHRTALRYIRTAAALAPQSRFVIRAAARYFLHIGDNEQAHDVLKGSPLLGNDPWVQASEISVATVRGRTSTLIKKANFRVTSAAVVGTDLTELASALATVELQAGAEKKAKLLFRKSLINPNDNTVAQAEWAASRLKLIVDDSALRTPMSFEANSNNAYRKLLIREAIEFAREWAADEPYASRPLAILCYLYSLERRFDEAQKYAIDAIKADGPDSFALQLNLLFTRIQQGDVDASHFELLRLAKRPEAKKHATHIYANAGALAYATGDFVVGREFYQKAIQAARRRSEPGEEALARAYFALEAVTHQDPDFSVIVQEAARSVEQLPNPGALYLMRGLVDSERQKIIETTANRRVAKRHWEWDAATNTLQTLD
jgi:tetratricopeptide (TPR) repeat protein